MPYVLPSDVLSGLLAIKKKRRNKLFDMNVVCMGLDARFSIPWLLVP